MPGRTPGRDGSATPPRVPGVLRRQDVEARDRSRLRFRRPLWRTVTEMGRLGAVMVFVLIWVPVEIVILGTQTLREGFGISTPFGVAEILTGLALLAVQGGLLLWYLRRPVKKD